MRIPLDTTDEEILRALQPDGRRSFRDIAREIGVSEGTVRSRVRRLQEMGALRILAFVDPARLGQSVLALMLVRVDSETQDTVIRDLTSWPEITYISTLIGRADIYAQIMCASNEALGEIISRTRALPGVIETETMLELAVHKFSYNQPDAASLNS